MEALKFTILMRGRDGYLTDRYSDRNERALKGFTRKVSKIQIRAESFRRKGYECCISSCLDPCAASSQQVIESFGEFLCLKAGRLSAPT
jgi:hypothetical protein